MQCIVYLTLQFIFININLIVILKKLREFFNKNPANSINFWDCPSNNNWPLHSIVDKETKDFNFIPLFLCKLS